MADAAPNAAAPASDWWPYRNQMLLTFAAMKCIGLGVTKLLIGTVRSDGSHIDGTPEFVHLMDQLLSMQEGGLIFRPDEMTEKKPDFFIGVLPVKRTVNY